MRGTRLPVLALVLALVVVSAVAIVVIDPAGTPTPSPASFDPGASTPRATVEPESGFIEVDAAAGGPNFTLETASRPTADVPQSKLWFHDGAWWGILVAEGSGEFRIHRFDWAGRRWLDTGTRVASRASVHPDALAEGDQLWVVTGGGHPLPRGSIALFRYTYDPDGARYVPDSDFPVTVAEGQEAARSATLARDDAGRLWAAWMREGALAVSRTDGSDWTWVDPFLPPVPNADSPIDAVAMVEYGETVALLWAAQTADAISMAVPQLDDATAWEHATVAVEGVRLPDDELNVSVLETDPGPRLFAAIKTSIGTEASSRPGDPQVVLLVIEPDGSSRQYLVGRVRDDLTRPLVLVDGENEVVYVVATLSSAHDAIHYKASGIDDISFALGEGTPLLQVDGLVALNSATSTKQTLDSATGLLVLASDAEAGSYAWASGLLPGAGSPSLDPVAEPAPSDDPLLFDTFDTFQPGSALDPMWVATTSGSATFTIADTGDGRRVAAASATDGSSVRACREIVGIAGGRVRIEADVMVTRIGGSDVTVTAARHDGAQTAVVRLDDSGVFSYFDGAAQVRSQVRYATGVWYTSEVEIDLDAQTYSWRVQRASDGVTALAVEGAGWRSAASGPVTDVCIESAEAAGEGTSFAVDRIRVER